MKKLCRWTEDQKEFLEAFYGTKTISWIAAHIPGSPRSKAAIWREAYRMGLKTDYAVWSPEDVELLKLWIEKKSHDPEMSYRDIAVHFPNRFYDQVYGKIQSLKKATGRRMSQ